MPGARTSRRSVLRAAAVVAFPLSLSCGPGEGAAPPPLEPAPLEPVCGQPSPLRILPLDDDQSLIEGENAVTRVGDRVYFIIGRGTVLDDGRVTLGFSSFAEATTVVSTGPCGEDPRVIARDIDRVFEHPRWPGLLLGSVIASSDDSEPEAGAPEKRPPAVVVLDPEGERAPRRLLSDVGASRWTDHGRVQVLMPSDGASPLSIRLFPFPDGPGAGEPDAITIARDVPRAEGYVAVRGNHVFFPDGTGGVSRIDLPDVAHHAEPLSGLTHFEVSLDGRFILWESTDRATTKDGVVERFILDRQSGDSEPLGAWKDVELHDDYIVLSRWGPAAERVVNLPNLELVDSEQAVIARADATSWITWHSPATFSRLSLSGATDRLVDAAPFGLPDLHGDHLHVIRCELPCSRKPGENQGELISVDLRRGEARRIADRAVNGYVHLADDRVLTALDVDETKLGRLALTEGDGVATWEIDTHVSSFLGAHQGVVQPDPDVILYAVSDGARSGLWLARLPPP